MQRLTVKARIFQNSAQPASLVPINGLRTESRSFFSKFTCIRHNGLSVVDYCRCLEQVANFDFPGYPFSFADHGPFTVEIKWSGKKHNFDWKARIFCFLLLQPKQTQETFQRVNSVYEDLLPFFINSEDQLVVLQAMSARSSRKPSASVVQMPQSEEKIKLLRREKLSALNLAQRKRRG